MVWGESKGLVAGDSSNVYVAATAPSGEGDGYAIKFHADGQKVWSFISGPPGVNAMALDTNGHVYLTGGVNSGFAFGTFKLDDSGNALWQRNYPASASRPHQGEAIDLDSMGSVYVTGVSTNTTTRNDFATIKYDNDGNQLWVKRYNGPANGDDGAMAIAVASDGSLYVTGYSANTNGGVDITTIKYGVLTNVQKKTDGTIQLQFFGTPGLSYGFQGTTNFEFWDELGTSVADTNGIIEFLDTNAPLFPHRFYRWHFP